MEKGGKWGDNVMNVGDTICEFFQWSALNSMTMATALDFWRSRVTESGNLFRSSNEIIILKIRIEFVQVIIKSALKYCCIFAMHWDLHSWHFPRVYRMICISV